MSEFSAKRCRRPLRRAIGRPADTGGSAPAAAVAMSEEPTGIVAVVIAEGTARPPWRLVVLPAGRLWLHSVQQAVRGDEK